MLKSEVVFSEASGAEVATLAGRAIGQTFAHAQGDDRAEMAAVRAGSSEGVGG